MPAEPKGEAKNEAAEVTQPAKPAVVGEMKPFKNRMLTFPPDILASVDKMILQGKGGKAIRTWLEKTYKGGLDVPTPVTISTYIEHRKKVLFEMTDANIRLKKELEYTENELKDLYAKLDIANLPLDNSVNVIDKIIRFLLIRVQKNTSIQDVAADPRFEQVITNQLARIESLTELKLKLQGELGSHEAVARKIVDKFLAEFAGILFECVKRLAEQETARKILAEVQKKVGDIDMERIKHEAIVEAAAEEKTDGSSSNRKTNGVESV